MAARRLDHVDDRTGGFADGRVGVVSVMDEHGPQVAPLEEQSVAVAAHGEGGERQFPGGPGNPGPRGLPGESLLGLGTADRG